MLKSSGKRFSWLMSGDVQMAPYDVGAAYYVSKTPHGLPGDAPHALAIRLEGLIRIAQAQEDHEVARNLWTVLANVRKRLAPNPPIPWDGRERRASARYSFMPIEAAPANDQ